MLPPAPHDLTDIEAMLTAVHEASTSLDVALTTWHQVAREASIPDEDDTEVTPFPDAPSLSSDPTDGVDLAASMASPVSLVVPTPHRRSRRAGSPGVRRLDDAIEVPALRAVARARRGW